MATTEERLIAIIRALREQTYQFFGEPAHGIYAWRHPKPLRDTKAEWDAETERLIRGELGAETLKPVTFSSTISAAAGSLLGSLGGTLGRGAAE